MVLHPLPSRRRQPPRPGDRPSIFAVRVPVLVAESADAAGRRHQHRLPDLDDDETHDEFHEMFGMRWAAAGMVAGVSGWAARRGTAQATAHWPRGTAALVLSRFACLRCCVSGLSVLPDCLLLALHNARLPSCVSGSCPPPFFDSLQCCSCVLSPVARCAYARVLSAFLCTRSVALPLDSLTCCSYIRGLWPRPLTA